MNELILYLIIGLVIGAIISYIIHHFKSAADIKLLQSQLQSTKKLLEETEQRLRQEQLSLTELQAQNNSYRSERDVAEANLRQLGEQLQILKTEFAQERQLLQKATEDKDRLSSDLAVALHHAKTIENQFEEHKSNVVQLEERFENLANKIFEEKNKVFKGQSKEHLKDVLEPLKERIVSFEKRVNQVHRDSVEQQAGLRQELKQLQELNQKISQEANNLTKALKGDKKMQGNWGELVLERVLEKSGLTKGVEYITQAHLTDEEGRRYHPDVLIHMPDETHMIIDSKVSLIAYEKMINADTEQERTNYQKEHTQAILRHIQSLSSKSYHELIDGGPDFVLMFIPIETAFASAIAYDENLYLDAFEKNIIIVTPSTLLATLKTIDARWKNEKQRRNALEIAKEAGKMYDKFTGLLDDLKKLGQQMDTTKRSYDAAMNKIVDGSGNLIRRAEKLKTLGAKANKQIETGWIHRAESE